MNAIRHLMAIAVLVMAPMCLSARQYFVAPTGGDDSGEGTSDNPFATLTKAADMVRAAGDEIILKDGTYLITEPFRLSVSNVVVRSESGNRASVTLDGQGRSSWALLTRYDVIRDITLVHSSGYLGADSTYGLYLASGSMVSNCVICDSVAVTDGARTASGAAVMALSGSRVVDSVIENCVASNSSTTVKNVHGGGVSLDASSMEGCLVRNCRAYGYAGNGTTTVAGGGVYAGKGSVIKGSVISNCVANIRVTTGTQYGSSGGGVYLNASSIADSLVVDCVAEAQGGGLAAEGAKVSVERCTFERNSLASFQTSFADLGSAVYFDTTDAVIADSVFRYNTNAYLTAYGSGTVALRGTVTMTGCLIEKNVARQGNAIMLSINGNGTVISNCLMTGNVRTLDTGHTCCGGVISTYRAGSALITDCIVSSNLTQLGSQSAAILRYNQDSANNSGLTFRNCYFTGNNSPRCTTAVGVLFQYSNGSNRSSPLHFEYCTFAGNLANVTDSTGFFKFGTLADASQVFFKGCVLADNGKTKTLGLNSDFAAVSSVSYTYASSGNYSLDAAYHNVDPATDPKFRDVENGDYRLAAGSPLIDVGGPVEAWMQGRKSLDMADGTFKIAANGKYGVTLSRDGKTCRRLYGNGPDIGCYEYFLPSGLILLFR